MVKCSLCNDGNNGDGDVNQMLQHFSMIMVPIAF